jgi:hypothetical protein
MKNPTLDHDFERLSPTKERRMRTTRTLGAFVVGAALALAIGAWHGAQAADEAKPEAKEDWATIAAANKKEADEVRAKIKGRENAPADSVFENIKMFKGVPASRLVNAMEMGFSPALGAKCTLCHVEDKWASEDKKEKQVARDMAAMARTINDSLLTKIPHLDSEHPQVTCTTCHRGQKKPATSMPKS